MQRADALRMLAHDIRYTPYPAGSRVWVKRLPAGAGRGAGKSLGEDRHAKNSVRPDGVQDPADKGVSATVGQFHQFPSPGEALQV